MHDIPMTPFEAKLENGPYCYFLTTAAIIGGSSLISGYLANKGAKKQAQAAERAADASAQVQKEMYDTTREDMAPWREVGGQALYRLSDLMGIQPRVPAAAGGAGKPVNMLARSLAMSPTTGANGDTAYEYLPKSDQFGNLSRRFTMEDFYNDPGYAFRFNEGVKALDRSAAARGNLFSGGHGKALQDWGQGLANQEYGNAFNRWKAEQGDIYNRLAGLSGAGQTTAAQLGQFGQNTAMGVGNAMSQGYLNQGNARASGYAGMNNALMSGLGLGLNYYQNQDLLDVLKAGG